MPKKMEELKKGDVKSLSSGGILAMNYHHKKKKFIQKQIKFNLHSAVYVLS